MIYDESKNRKKIEKIIHRWKHLWKKKISTVKMFKSAHMPIPLKSNWANNHKINRVYSVRIKNQKFINEIFDKLHEQKKMKWFSWFIFFEYSVFVIWKIVIKKNKLEKKKTRDNKHSWFKSNNSNERLFHVISIWHNNSCDWMQLYFDCWCPEILLSMNNAKKKSL